jgi:hypothetical protein
MNECFICRKLGAQHYPRKNPMEWVNKLGAQHYPRKNPMEWVRDSHPRCLILLMLPTTPMHKMWCRPICNQPRGGRRYNWQKQAVCEKGCLQRVELVLLAMYAVFLLACIYTSRVYRSYWWKGNSKENSTTVPKFLRCLFFCSAG